MRLLDTDTGAMMETCTEAEAEAADCVVCATADTRTPWRDNVTTTCHDCSCAIIHRPHAPKRPPKVCMDCAVARMEGGHA